VLHSQVATLRSTDTFRRRQHRPADASRSTAQMFAEVLTDLCTRGLYQRSVPTRRMALGRAPRLARENRAAPAVRTITRISRALA
jgi:hypothetical protein